MAYLVSQLYKEILVQSVLKDPKDHLEHQEKPVQLAIKEQQEQWVPMETEEKLVQLVHLDLWVMQ